MIFIVLVIVLSCAVQKAPLGGKKDETPPVLDTLKSTPNYLTNFDLEKVVLRFDEFIELKNAFEQIVYSPPLKTKPEIVQRGKKITLKFPATDTLKANTTYTINFGEAIVDLNEGNPLTNFRYVFSTGDIIDSLSIRGSVIDDATNEPSEGTLIMLYDQLSDSIVYKEQPYYFAKTNASGRFEIQNLRSDTFKVFVLADENLNLKYDDGESIGFLDTFIYVTDSTPADLELNLFKPDLPIELRKDDFVPYKIKFEFDQSPDTVSVRSKRDSIYWIEEVRGDSLILWHDNSVPNDTFYVLGDTIDYKRRVFRGELEPTSFSKSNLGRKGKLKPNEAIELEFKYAIKDFDPKLFELSDSLVRSIENLTRDTLNPRKINIEYPFKYGDTMALYILPGAINLINGNVNDTIQELIIPESKENYGTLFLTVDSLDTEQQYILELFDGDRLYLSRVIEGEKQAKFTFPLLPPKTFDVRLTLDRNRNGKWDPGSYIQKTQSEKWQLTTLEALRENWELEAIVKWKR